MEFLKFIRSLIEGMCLTLLVILLSGLRVSCYMYGAPNFSCKDPSVFHTRKINATHEGIIMPQDMGSSPYALAVSSQTFRPGQRIRVSIYTTDPKRKLKGFFIQAVQNNIGMRDLRRRPYGTFMNTTRGERPSICQSTRNGDVGGITHTINRTRSVVTVIWIAPTGAKPENLQFLATGVEDFNTYWTNIRSPSLQPMNYTITADDNTGSDLTPAAAWYQWLQYLHNFNFENLSSMKSPTTKSKDSAHSGTVPAKSSSKQNRL